MGEIQIPKSHSPLLPTTVHPLYLQSNTTGMTSRDLAPSLSLTSDQAQALFDAGGFAIITDLPEGSEFSIDGT